jgi:hypothetical protein
MGCDSEGCEVGRCNYEGKPLVIAKSDKDRIAELECQLADEELAFNHANETIGKLEADLADVRKTALEEVEKAIISEIYFWGERQIKNQPYAFAQEVTRRLTAPPEQGKCFNCNFANLRTWEPSKILLCESCRRNGGTEDHYQPIAPPEQKNPCLICGHEIDEHEYREATNSVVCPPPEPQSKEERK